MRIISIIILSWLLINAGYSQSAATNDFKEEPSVLNTNHGDLKGSILLPEHGKTSAVVLIIAGSGPTDRDGNNNILKNNSLKFLAEGLAQSGIASLRYDKRGVSESAPAAIPEDSLRFNNFVNDAIGWFNQLKNDTRFNKIYILGHSEGSLIGILVAEETSPDGFISLEGAGKPADKLIREQLMTQPDTILKLADPVLTSLSDGNTTKQVPPMLNYLFRPSVQPYLISWFNIDPTKEIAKLKIPILIVQGSHDLQISEENAKSLATASKHAELTIIDGMNHILKDAEADRRKNFMTYNNPDLPINKELIETLVKFIKH